MTRREGDQPSIDTIPTPVASGAPFMRLPFIRTGAIRDWMHTGSRPKEWNATGDLGTNHSVPAHTKRGCPNQPNGAEEVEEHTRSQHANATRMETKGARTDKRQLGHLLARDAMEAVRTLRSRTNTETRGHSVCDEKIIRFTRMKATTSRPHKELATTRGDCQPPAMRWQGW